MIELGKTWTTSIIPIVISIRERLSDEYNVNNIWGDNLDYRGLCDITYVMLTDRISLFNKLHGVDWKVIHFHGEQKHTPRINSKNWAFQHTWAAVTDGVDIIYVDITSQQFKWLYPDIPDYYISFKAPKWYYSDKKNPAYSGITGKLNRKFRIKRKIKLPNGFIVDASDGIIELCQYEIWGPLSNILRFIINL